MGQAFDRDGNVLGEAEGATKREVFEKLTEQHPDAHEVRIRTIEDRLRESTNQQGAANDLEVRDLNEQFRYHVPHGDQVLRYKEIRDAAKAFALVILRTVPRCADRTVAIRKIREATMTANAAIAISEAIPNVENP